MNTETSEATAPAVRPDTSRAAFDGDQRGVRAGRRWVAHQVEGRSRADDVETVTEELARNAACHGAGALFTVILELEEAGMAVVVRDGGSTRSEPRVSELYQDEHGCEHGHGMVLVAELSDEWDTSAGAFGRDTWAWFDAAPVGRSAYLRPHVATEEEKQQVLARYGGL